MNYWGTTVSQEKSTNFSKVQAINSENFSKERKILWWKPWLDNTALHKNADLEIANQIARRNYQVHIIVPTTMGKMVLSNSNPKIIISSVQIKFLPILSPLVRSFLIAFLMPFYIVSSKPNFVITEPDVSILGFLPTIIICRLLGIKVILDIRSVPVETFGFEGFMINLWFNFSVLFAKRLFDGITTITSLMKEELKDKFQLNKKQIGVWTSGVSTSLFSPQKYSSESSILKKNLGLSSKFIVFYHGKFSPTRGLKQTVEAIRKLSKTHPQIILFLLGSGPIASELKRLVRSEDLEKNVFIHDPVDHTQTPLFISMCDVAIIPLPNNQFWRSQSPLKLLEYLAMEKVTIVSDIPAHRLVLGKSECCLYFSLITPSNIAQVVEFAYLNEKKLMTWGKSGRKIVLDNFTWEKIALDFDNFLSSLL